VYLKKIHLSVSAARSKITSQPTKQQFLRPVTGISHQEYCEVNSVKMSNFLPQIYQIHSLLTSEVKKYLLACLFLHTVLAAPTPH